jgi:plasmid replication initiation protein
MDKKKNNYLVSKSNDLIEARYRLSVQEQRLIAIMVSDIKPNDRDFKNYSYKITDFIEWVGVDGKDYYKELRKITAKLLTRLITIKQDNTLFQTSWLAGAKYHLGKGIIELSFHPDLKPYLLQLKDCFTQYALKNVLELKSKYAFRLYELLKQYQSIGKRKFAIMELRELLGVEKNELKLWIHFKTRVLEISKREINAKTDLKIDYKTEKIGRKIEYIIFSIKAQDKEKIKITDEQNKRYDELLKLVPEEYRELKTLKNAIIKYLKKKGYEYVKRNIKYANTKAEKNYRAFLINSLKEDWALSWIEDKELSNKQRKEEIKTIIQIEKQAERKIKKLTEEQIELNRKKLQEIKKKLNLK